VRAKQNTLGGYQTMRLMRTVGKILSLIDPDDEARWPTSFLRSRAPAMRDSALWMSVRRC
jgi:hypothetical protein